MTNDFGNRRSCAGGCFSKILVVVVILVVVSQFQSTLVDILGGAGGSFGLRPVSNICVGFPLDAQNTLDWFAEDDTETHLGALYVRIWIDESHLELNRPYCLGQDIWLAE